MKKTTIIGKKQILMVAMVLALGAAVWLNVEYATDGSGFATSSKASDSELGSTKYVANTSVSMSADDGDYFVEARKDREDTREDELDIIKETLASKTATDKEKQAAKDKTLSITERMEMENSAETLIKAKGFSDAIVIISDNSCSIVVKKSSELEKSEMIQVLDVATSTTKINPENIKIVAVK